MPRKKSIISVAISVALAVGSFATALQCADARELKLWRHGVLDAKSDAGFSFMIDQGFAEKQGLKLKLLQF